MFFTLQRIARAAPASWPGPHVHRGFFMAKKSARLIINPVLQALHHVVKPGCRQAFGATVKVLGAVRPAYAAFLLLMSVAATGAERVAAGEARDAEPIGITAVHGDAVALSLDGAVEVALSKNADLSAAEANARAFQAVPSQEGSLPDPVLGLNVLNLPTDTFDLNQESMTQVQLTLSQAFPFPGKLGLRRAAAAQEADAATIRVSERRLSLTAQVRAAWWSLFYLDRALEIVGENQNLMREFNKIAQTKYEVGRGLQQDVLLAQLELSRLLDRELNLQGMRKAAQADLNKLLDQPADVRLQVTREPPSKALPDVLGEDELHRRAMESRPLLAVQRQLVGAAKTRRNLARKDYYPDFKLGAGYGYREGSNALGGEERPDFFSVMFSINLPIYFKAKQDKAVDQRTSEVQRQQFNLEDTLRQVQAEISSDLADYQRARNQVMLFETGIIPQARQTVASMLAGYQVNEVDFLNLVTTQITLYDYQIQYWKALNDGKAALAKLAAATGMEALYE